MYNIKEKNFIFTTSVLLEKGEIAVVNVPGFPGLNFNVEAYAKTDAVYTQGDLKTVVNGSEVQLAFPWTPSGDTLSFEANIGTSIGELSARVAAATVGTMMIVHLHFYRKNTA
jgi:hypothetical protein